MKIAFISDLHVDSLPASPDVIDCIHKRLLSIKPDVFIIAGDIAARTQLFEQTLGTFSALPCEKLLVPGNHDIWVESSSLEKGIHSGVKYTEIIPQICSRNDFIFLGVEPCVIDGIGFAGTIGWYDYTLRNKVFDNLFSMDTYRKKNYKNRFTWNDLKFAHWMDIHENSLKSDQVVAREMEDALQAQIQSLNQKHINQIIVVTHHIPFQKMVIHPNRLPFDFFSAYMGSSGLGSTILDEPSVKYVISGHSHIKSSHTIGNLQAMKSPLGYPREWKTNDIHKLIEERLSFFEI
jgi:Icc-related predicted phosphoesterase